YYYYYIRASFRFYFFAQIIPLNELELNVTPDDDSLIQTLKNSSYAAIFTGYDVGDSNNNNIILVNGITIDKE
ncbi:MAG: hypothetical protein ACJ72T_01910, partial [Nitrososphaeraceae archaeon]